MDALTTLAFNYSRRAGFFRDELEQYLLLTREQGTDIFSIKGSYAGAIGIPQFMPSSYRKYAVDFDNDGQADNPSCVGSDYDDYCTAANGCHGGDCSNEECYSDCLGMNDCDLFQECSDCVSTDFMSLENYVNNVELDLNNYMSYLYYDRFNLFSNNTNDIYTHWELKPVTYYDGSEGNGRDGRSPYNIYNMVGNVWEWTEDWFSRYHNLEINVNPSGPEKGNTKVIKGGSFLCHDSYCNRYRVSARSANSCLLYKSPSPRDGLLSRMTSSA